MNWSDGALHRIPVANPRPMADLEFKGVIDKKYALFKDQAARDLKRNKLCFAGQSWGQFHPKASNNKAQMEMNSVFISMYFGSVMTQVPGNIKKRYTRRWGMLHSILFRKGIGHELHLADGFRLLATYVAGLEDVLGPCKYLGMAKNAFDLDEDTKVDTISEVLPRVADQGYGLMSSKDQQVVDAVAPLSIVWSTVHQMRQEGFFNATDDRELYNRFAKPMIVVHAARFANQLIIKACLDVILRDLALGPAGKHNAFGLALNANALLLAAACEFQIDVPTEEQTFTCWFAPQRNVNQLGVQRIEKERSIGGVKFFNYSGTRGKSLMCLGLAKNATMRDQSTEILACPEVFFRQNNFVLCKVNGHNVTLPADFSLIPSIVDLRCSITVLDHLWEQFTLEPGRKVVVSHLDTNGVKSAANHCRNANCKDKFHHGGNRLLQCSCFCMEIKQDGPRTAPFPLCIKVSEMIFSQAGRFLLVDPYPPVINDENRVLNPGVFLSHNGKPIWPTRQGSLYLESPRELIPLFAGVENMDLAELFQAYKSRAMMPSYLTISGSARNYMSELYHRELKLDSTITKGFKAAHITPHQWRALWPLVILRYFEQFSHFREKVVKLDLPAGASIAETLTYILTDISDGRSAAELLKVSIVCPTCSGSLQLDNYPTHVLKSHPDMEAFLLSADPLGSSVRAAQSLILDCIARVCQYFQPHEQRNFASIREAHKAHKWLMEEQGKLAATNSTLLKSLRDSEERLAREEKAHIATKKQLNNRAGVEAEEEQDSLAKQVSDLKRQVQDLTIQVENERTSKVRAQEDQVRLQTKVTQLELANRPTKYVRPRQKRGKSPDLTQVKKQRQDQPDRKQAGHEAGKGQTHHHPRTEEARQPSEMEALQDEMRSCSLDRATRRSDEQDGNKIGQEK